MLILAFQIQIKGKIIYILIIFVFLFYFLGKIIRQLSLFSLICIIGNWNLLYLSGGKNMLFIRNKQQSSKLKYDSGDVIYILFIMKRDDDKHVILFIAVFLYFLEHCVSCGGLCSVFEQKYVVRYTLIEYFRRISKEKWQNFEVTARFACLKDFFALTEDLCRVDWCIFFAKYCTTFFFLKRSFNLVLLEEHILY